MSHHAHECRRVADNETAILKADEGDEQADACRNGDLHRIRNGCQDLLAQTGNRKQQEEASIDEDQAERALPGNSHPNAEAEGKERVDAIPGASARGKLVNPAIRTVASAALSAVAVTSAASGIPAFLRMLGFTARM
jgi:hypothetical protein